MSVPYHTIARVAKAHGRTGEVVAVPADGLPSLLRVGMHVAVVPPQLNASRFHEVLAVGDGERGQLVRLSGARGIADAEALVGRHVLAREDELPKEVSFLSPEWAVGREVRDVTRGVLGTVVEVLRGPANDVWVIGTDDGDVLFPVVEELLVDLPRTGPLVINARDEDLVR